MAKDQKKVKNISTIDNVPYLGHCEIRDSAKWLSVIFHEPARKELSIWPDEIKKDLGSVITKLQKGLSVKSPESKSMKSVGAEIQCSRI